VWEASDEALLAGFGTGDPTAAAVFVRRFQSRVHGLAGSVVGSGPAAADVAQEAFLRAWRHANAYDARRGSVTTWLLAITRNVAIDHIRMRRSRPSEVLDTELLSMTKTVDDPAADAVVSDGVDRVRRVLDRLPDTQRRALVLASVGGRTALEIAEIEQIPLGTAKTRIRTALLRVRAELHERDDEEADRD
jgi:RNA polymerase sigma factor (sigma-70 family)